MRTLLALAMLTAMVPSAGRAADLSVAAAPGSAQARTFATPAVPLIPGMGLSLLNADAAFHSILSDAIGPNTNSWCGPRNPGPEGPNNPRRFPLGQCPLFWSDLAQPLGSMRRVLGVDALVSGRAYGFRCGVYEDMTGVVLT